jgi:ABC-type multidrug transport system fused ATPase/permease subunit
MAKPEPSIVKRSLFSWIFAPGNRKLQLLLLLISFVIMFASILPLEMQRRIVNEAIKLRDIDKLFMYCGIYLAAVVFSSVLKYLINVFQTLISQRTTARMRKDLYAHILTLPLNFFRKTQPGSVVNALSTELTLPGNFVGMAVGSPASNVLKLLGFAVYLFWLNPLLAAVSLSIYPLVMFLIPLLQRGVNKANKKRVDAARTFSSRIAESISGIHEIHGNGAYRIEGRKYNKLVDRLLKIRIVWSLYRFAVKSTNGFFTSLGPFLVFLLGGYLTIKGQLELGALVAFLSAQERLFDPWKELIEFYQVYQDGQINYRRTMEYFDVEAEHQIEPRDRDALELEGSVEVKDLSFVTDTGIHLLDGINLSLNQGEHLALVGFSGSGKSTLAMCIGQLYKYTSGSVMIGDKEVSGLTKKDMINNIGFVAQNPFIFDGTIEENILYSCRAKTGDNGQAEAGQEMPTLDDTIAVLHQTGIFVDVLRFGLNTILTHDKHADLVDVIVRIRKNFQRDYGAELADYVEFFDENKYLYHSSVAGNLTFGAPNKSEFSSQNLARSKYFLNFLDTADLTRPLLSLGTTLCRQTVDILGDLPPEAVFFEQSPINADELEEFKVLEEHLRKKRLHELDDEDHHKLLELALRFTPGTHKMAALPDILEMLILEGRALLHEKIAQDDPGAFTFYQMSEYIYSQTILNNIFFGKTKTSNPQAQEIIDQSIIQLLIEEDLLEAIIEIGMHYQVGTKGDKLSGGQQQKLAIARIFLKAPRILIMDEATSALDNKAQTRIQNLLETRWKKKSTVVSVVHRLDTIKNYDKVAVMKAGKILETGTYDELMARKGMLYELVGNK